MKDCLVHYAIKKKNLWCIYPYVQPFNIQQQWNQLENIITLKVVKHIKKHLKKQPSYLQVNHAIFEYNDPALILLKQ
jgi:hypothetical protein